MAKRRRQTENDIPENEQKSAAEVKSPVTLWYRPVKDTATDATAFIDVHLMLEDAELGVMPPNMYFFAAENSKRAEELNFIAIDCIAYALDTAKTEWNAEPTFSLMVTTRFLESDEMFNAFLAKLESMEISRKRIILTFSALTVLHLGRRVNTYLRRLKEEGYTVALTDYAVDTAHFSLLFDYTFDILRIDADYLADSYMYSRKKSAVEVLAAFAEKENIKLVANGVGDMKMKSVMSELGLTVMCGRAVARGTDKLERALGIETKEEPEEKGEEEREEHPFETVEAEAPAARASASKKIKNKTAVLEEEVEELENAPEPTEPEEQPEVEESTEPEAEEQVEVEETPIEEVAETEEAEEQSEPEVEELAEVEEPTEVEEPAEIEETAEEQTETVEEPIEPVEETPTEEVAEIEEVEKTAEEVPTEEIEPIAEETAETVEPEEEGATAEVEAPAEVAEPVEAEEQIEVVETTETEEQPEPEAEEQTEVVEETTAEEPTDIDEISTTASESEAIYPERSDDIPTSESEVIYPSQGDDLPASETRDEETTTASDSEAISLSQGDNFTATEGSNDTADEVRDEEGEVRDENTALAEFLLFAGIDFLTEEDIAKVLYGGLDALDEEKRNKVIEALENLG